MQIYEHELNFEQEKFIRRLKYLFWWETENEFLEHPEQTLAHAMDACREEDWLQIEKLFPRHMLIEVLDNSSMGDFSPPAWVLWNARLHGIIDRDKMPPMPARKIPEDFDYRNL